MRFSVQPTRVVMLFSSGLCRSLTPSPSFLHTPTLLQMLPSPILFSILFVVNTLMRTPFFQPAQGGLTLPLTARQ